MPCRTRIAIAPLGVVALVAASVFLAPAAGAGATSGVELVQRLGYAAGDDWEPAIAAGRSGHVYVLWKHYDPPGFTAAGCGDPSGCDRRLLLQVSDDGGRTFGAPRAIDPGRVGYDSQLVVDPLDGRTVSAAFLVGVKSSIGFTRSTDFGRTWSAVTLTDDQVRGTDKTILAARGADVYIAWNAAQRIYVSVSHDGGQSWTNALAGKGGQLGWALASGATIAPDGTVHVAWAGYEQNGGAKGPVNLFLTSSADGGTTWRTRLVDRSEAPPSCDCAGWAYYGAQMVVAADATGRLLHVAYNLGSEPFGPGRLYHRSSTDGGASWSRRVDLSRAAAGANHVFPAIAAAGPGDLRVAWMDDRTGAYRVYLRTSADGGATWAGETVVSRDLGAPYQSTAGFVFPYGDYFEIEIDDAGRTVAAWGEGPGWDGPGNVYFGRVRWPGP